MRFWPPLVALALLLAPAADARMHAGPPVMSAHHRLRVPLGALDGGIVSAPAAAGYSFRLLRQAYLGTGAAVRLRRASDQAESNIGFSGSGGLDTASAATFCAATSCFIRTWYDQSGNARDAVQATAASQPALVFNCIGTLPCMQTTAVQNVASVSTTLVPVLPTSFSAVGNRNAGPNNCTLPGQQSGNVFRARVVANLWEVFGGTTIFAAANDNVWHAASAVVNGAASVLRVDATETTGTVAGLTAAGPFFAFGGSPSTTCSVAEVIAWDGYALTAGERAVLTANQRAYWGF